MKSVGLAIRGFMVLGVFRAAFALATQAEPTRPVPTFYPPHGVLRDDASLNDVAFVDAEYGWAVGNRGVILHTVDGGVSWQAQESGTDATLEAVHFVGRHVGYAVGGCAWPEGGGTSGVLLCTGDGGEHWETVSRDRTGWLHAVWGDSQGHGWVLGEPTPVETSGLWHFRQSGERLEPVRGRAVGAILAADFSRDGRGIAVGRDGTCVVLRSGDLTTQRQAVSFQGRLNGITLIGGGRACMVGDRGTVFISKDGGRTWTAVRLDLPPGLREIVNLTDVAFADSSLGWIVGDNGNYVLSTADGGGTWRLRPTQLRIPLRAIAVVDSRTLVAVGEWGLIARSADGGETWSAVRHGDRRTGALLIATSPRAWVWPLAAHLVGYYRCRTACLQATSGMANPGAVRWAANACGASTIRLLEDFDEPPADWAIPTTWPAGRRPGEVANTASLFQYWSRRLDRDAERSMRRGMVASIRALRPALVVVDQPIADESADMVASSVAEVAMTAVEGAADAEFMPELRLLGLQPHRASRVVVFRGEARGGARHTGDKDPPDLRIGLTDTFYPLLGSNARLAGLRASGYLGLSLDGSPIALTFRALKDRVSGKPSGDLFGAFRLPAEARLGSATDSRPSRFEELKEASDALAVAAKMADRRGNPAQMVQLAVRAARRFPDSIAPADALYEAARQFERNGRYPVADEVWRAFLEHGRPHPAWATVAIGQATRRASVEHYQTTLNRSKDPLQGCRVAVDILERLCNEEPHVIYQPAMLFAQAHCRRALGQWVPARHLYTQCAASRLPGWSTVAAAELWLMEGPTRQQGACPRYFVEAYQTTERPKIDGRLDDQIWQRCPKTVLKDASGRPVPSEAQTSMQFAWNKAYLYVSATVQSPVRQREASNPREPVRDQLDQDVSSIECLLDVDRDAATFFRIAVDRSGNGLDACGDDLSWNLPLQTSALSGAWQWAVERERDGWRLEMAIPTAPMVSMTPEAGQAWAVQVVCRPARYERRQSIQWLSAQPGSEPLPQHFALLMFVGAR